MFVGLEGKHLNYENLWFQNFQEMGNCSRKKKSCVIDICDTDICDKRNSGIYLMTDPSAQGYPPSLADGRTDRKISRTQETLHSCQSWNDQKPIGNHSPDFSVILAF